MFKKNDRNNELTKISGMPPKNDNILSTIMSNFSNYEEGSRSLHYKEDKQTKTLTISGKRNGEFETYTVEEGLGEVTIHTRLPLLDKKYDYKEEILRLYYEKKLTQNEIAKRLDISQSTVSRYIREL
ncbi:sigma factor-like helix-turn-helix DNA-binding protein [Lysinibacillus sp. NPDC093197]|uniref:sigma factor-like helix-turn-helix DNA-binding protein n=1 Tax=Lysinibacillus sp. NPDC093197 TaxID=3364132 RepID=UPI00380DB9C3